MMRTLSRSHIFLIKHKAASTLLRGNIVYPPYALLKVYGSGCPASYICIIAEFYDFVKYYWNVSSINRTLF